MQQKKRAQMWSVFFKELIPSYTLLVGRVGPECVNNFANSLHLKSGSSRIGPSRTWSGLLAVGIDPLPNHKHVSHFSAPGYHFFYHCIMHQLKIDRWAQWTNNKHLNSPTDDVIYWWRCPLSAFSFGFVLTSLFGKFSADMVPIFYKFRLMFTDFI